MDDTTVLSQFTSRMMPLRVRTVPKRLVSKASTWEMRQHRSCSFDNWGMETGKLLNLPINPGLKTTKILRKTSWWLSTCFYGFTGFKKVDGSLKMPQSLEDTFLSLIIQNITNAYPSKFHAQAWHPCLMGRNTKYKGSPLGNGVLCWDGKIRNIYAIDLTVHWIAGSIHIRVPW